MKTVRRFIQNPRVFDTVVVLLASALLFGAYLTAYAFVIQENKVVEPAGKIGEGIVLGAWLATTGVLFAAFARGLRAGKPWHNALPDGYVGSLTAALTFGGAWIVDNAYWAPTFVTTSVGLDALFTPPRLVLIAAAAVMVSGPLRAAARRGETTAGVTTLISAALLLSVFTFATQFVHPLIDPYALKDYQFVPTGSLAWLGENVGVAEILAQALILAGTGLLLNSGFKLRPGSMTLVFTINGLFVTTSKLHYWYVPMMVVTGIAADVWIAYSARRPGRPSASLCAVIGGAFVVAYLITIVLLGGTSWCLSLWAVTIVATTMMCWMMGRLLRAGLPSAIVAPLNAEAPVSAPVEVRQEVRWTRDPEAGRLLLDYYVKKVGSHEVIMERLHLSRPTFYRRLQRGFALIAERLDEMSEFAEKVPVAR